MTNEIIFELLNRALTEEMGLVISINNPMYAQNLIQTARTGLDKYSELIITVPSTPDTIIIAKRSVDLEDYQ